MKDRLSKISKRATHALCLLAACGLTYSCADEYKFDDETPSWFSSSIYSYLEKSGNYTNFVRLINDLGYKEDLSATGSRTLFVANDSAFQRFYSNNATKPAQDPWHNATSYERLSKAQKNLLLKGAMLNNAYLMEMLSRGEGNPTPGTNMRKNTTLSLFDSLTVVTPETLPTSESTIDKKYWDQYKNKKNFYVLSDNSTPMLVFFSDDFMSKAGINDDDFQYLFGAKHESDEYYIYQNKVIEKDITCQNGYVHELENVLVPEPNMAEIIRNSGKSNIFSHILDRFSAPYYDKSSTDTYREEYDKGFQDSIYVRKYYSEITNHTSVADFINTDGKLTKGPDGEDPTENDEYGVGILKFDPGWNQYTSGSTSANSDMAAMFVPTDEAMMKYFKEGTGKTLLENYEDPNRPYDPSDVESLYHNLDRIPLNVLNSFVSNLMQTSFTASVPSKFGSILDQANDNLFKNPSEDVGNIESVTVGNNGAVYFMKKVYSPVDFSCVASPAFMGNDYKLMKFAIYCGSGDVWNSELMNKMNFFAYLRASGSRIKFSFFLPSDSALARYVDPLSIVPGREGVARVLSYKYKYQGDNVAPFVCTEYKYEIATGQIKDTNKRVLTKQDDPLNRLCDILETHTIVHDLDKEPLGVEGGNEYYLSKSGSPIRVIRNGQSMRVQGGMQVENQKNSKDNPMVGYNYATVFKTFKQADAGTENGLSNGTTYCIDAPIQPAVKSVYRVMSELPNQKFFDLCQGVTDELLVKTGLVTIGANETDDQKKTKYDMYRIFTNNNGLDNNVAFFSNFNYTVYVPSDDAVNKEINEKLLPTPESIEAYIAEHEGDSENWETVYKPRAKAQLELLLNFIRMHFQDNSLFADVLKGGTNTYNSATLDENGSNYVKIVSQQLGGGKIVVRSQNQSENCNVTGEHNLMARDYITNMNYSKGVTNLEGSTINSSAFSVVHEIDGVLRSVKIGSGTYKDLWDKQTKKVLASFHVKKK